MFARAPSSVPLRPSVDSFSTVDADVCRAAFFGFGTANVGFLRTRAAGRKTRATGNPAQIRNGPRRCVRRKRVSRRSLLRVAFSTFFPFANVFFRKIFHFSPTFASPSLTRSTSRVGLNWKTLVLSDDVCATRDKFRSVFQQFKRLPVFSRLFALRRPEKRIPLVRRPSRVFEVFLGEPQNRTSAATDGASIGSNPQISRVAPFFLVPTPTQPAI